MLIYQRVISKNTVRTLKVPAFHRASSMGPFKWFNGNFPRWNRRCTVFEWGSWSLFLSIDLGMVLKMASLRIPSNQQRSVRTQKRLRAVTSHHQFEVLPSHTRNPRHLRLELLRLDVFGMCLHRHYCDCQPTVAGRVFRYPKGGGWRCGGGCGLHWLHIPKSRGPILGGMTGPHTKKTLEVRYISSRTDGSEVFPLQLVNAVGCLGKVVMFCYCKINA